MYNNIREGILEFRTNLNTLNNALGIHVHKEPPWHI